MITHKYELSDGGYFWRFYPKCAISIKIEQSEVPSLFNPAPQGYTNVFHSLYGKFIRKYEEKSKLIVLFHTQSLYVMQDAYTGEEEARELQSYMLLQVDKNLYAYPFEKDMIYTISPTEIKKLR